jgi:hypothetical protein
MQPQPPDPGEHVDTPEPELPASEGATFGRRRGWSLGRRLREPDSYGILLVLILASILLFGVVADGRLGRFVVVVALMAILLFALRTSRAGRRIWRWSAILSGIVVIGSASAGAWGSGRVGTTVAAAAMAVLVFGTLLAIVVRLTAHPIVDGATVLGALCVYLLIALEFTALFSVLGGLSTGPFLQDGGVVAQGSGIAPTDLLYLSFVTISTVGYGDVTMLQSLPRLVAASEGVMGQLYLVTIVALVVGNIGHARAARPPRPPRQRRERRR